MTEIQKLLNKLETAQDDDLCELELKLFALIYDKKAKKDVVAVFDR